MNPSRPASGDPAGPDGTAPTTAGIPDDLRAASLERARRMRQEPRFPGGPAADPAGSHHERRIRSFQPRRSRVTPGQQDALERLWPKWGLDIDGLSALDLPAMFDGLPVVLEIGFGMGEATAQMAAADPGTGILAVDVHTPARATCSDSPTGTARPTSGSPTVTRSSCCARCWSRSRWTGCGCTSPTLGPRPATTSAG